jgi:cysteine desulfurase
VPSDICTGSITFSLGKGNTADEARLALDAMPGIVDRLRAMSPTYLDFQKQQIEGG